MVGRMALVASMLVLSALPAVAAEPAPETFYYDAGESFGTVVPVEAVKVPVGNWLEVEPDRALFEIELANGGSVSPLRTRIWVEVTQPIVWAPAAVSSEEVCPLHIYLGIGTPSGETRGYWYYCIAPFPVTEPGVYELDHDWSGLDAVEAKPGDMLFSFLWTTSTSNSAVPAYYLLGGPEAPSSVTVAGTTEIPDTEPVDPEVEVELTEFTSGPTTETSTSSTSASTTAPTPTEETTATDTGTAGPRGIPDAPLANNEDAKASPAGGILLVVLAALGLAARRRLP